MHLLIQRNETFLKCDYSKDIYENSLQIEQ